MLKSNYFNNQYDFLEFFYNDPLPNMVMSLDNDSLFFKICDHYQISIKFRENLPNLVVLLLLEPEL